MFFFKWLNNTVYVVFKISVILCMCLCECPYLWDGIYMTHLGLGEICPQFLGESLVSARGFLVSVGLWFYLDVHLCGCQPAPGHTRAAPWWWDLPHLHFQ